MSLYEIDVFTFLLINKTFQNKFLDILMPFITNRSYILFFLCAAGLAFKGKKCAMQILIIALASVALSDWASNILKHFFERVRPCMVLDVNLLAGCSNSYSMPSSHAANAFAFAMPFFLLSQRLIGPFHREWGFIRLSFIFIAFTVCISRVYVGVHYPSDVVAGALLGIFMSSLVIALYSWSYKRFRARPASTVLLVSLLAVSLFRIYYITSGPLDLSPDEAHYWEWSRRPALSYYSKGPGIAYLIALGTSVFGDTVFGIRVMAVIFYVLSTVLLYSLGKRLFNETTGLISALLLQVVPLFTVYGIVFTIDSPFIFFWILSLYLFWRAVNAGTEAGNQKPASKSDSSQLTVHFSPAKSSKFRTQGPELKIWLLLGLSIGLGLLTKYTMAFFYICAFLYLTASRETRKLIFSPLPYMAAITSLVVFSPVVFWNMGNDWVTLRHTVGQSHLAEGLRISLKSFLEFSGSQAGVISPVLFVLMMYALPKIKAAGYRPQAYYLFCFSIPILLFFLLKSLQGKVQANWALPGYITLIVAFSFFSAANWKKLKIWARGLIISAILIALSTTALAFYPAILRLPPKKDPTARLKGWKELGIAVSRVYEKLSLQGNIFVFSDTYQISSELAFYTKGHPFTYCINLGRRMNQYDLWPGFEGLIHYNAIFVTISDAELPEKLKSAFVRYEKQVVSTKAVSGKIRDYSVFTCYDFKGLRKELPGSY